MTRVIGIDISTFAVDFVSIPYDGASEPVWERFELSGFDAFERTRKVADVLPGRGSTYFDDVVCVGIEEPAGRNPGVIFRVQGAVLSCIPARMLVEKLMPAQWRKSNGMPGNCGKEYVGNVVHFAWPDLARDWPQDACDAYCIALATRSLITESEEAA